MNIRQEKNRKHTKFNIRNFFPNLTYLIPGIIGLLLMSIGYLFDFSWSTNLTWFLILLSIHFIYVGISESNASWNRNVNWFSILSIPTLLIILSIPLIFRPMWIDYKTAEKVDKILKIEEDIKLYYNDSNYLFILFIPGKAQPLAYKFGSSESYNAAKADLLDNKIKVIKKEYKSWLDDKAEVQYSIDGHTFD